MGESEGPTITYQTLNALREEDKKMTKALQFIVPVKHSDRTWGPSTYMHTKEPPIWEKQNYAQLLAHENIKPIVQITDEDVNIMKEKAWMGTLYDFDNWVGDYLDPKKNPAANALLNNIYPEWGDRQKQVIENYHNFKKRVETLKITGPKNKEDLFLMYRLGWPKESAQGVDDGIKTYASGQVPPGINQGFETTADKAAVNFQRGLFNVNRRDKTLKSLIGHERSVWQTDSGNKNYAQVKGALKTPFDAYPKVAWNNIA